MNQSQYDALSAITGGIGGIGQAAGTYGTMMGLGGAAAALAPPVAFAIAAFSITTFSFKFIQAISVFPVAPTLERSNTTLDDLSFPSANIYP